MKEKYLDKYGKLKTPLKLIGGKSKIREHLYSFRPNEYSTYVEPFLGSGSLLIGKEQDQREIVGDIQFEIINFFKKVQENPVELYKISSIYIEELRKIGKPYFLEVRDNRDAFAPDSLTSAARFYVLNRCAMNGIYRENTKGQCNSSYCGTAEGRGWFTLEWLLGVQERIKDVEFLNVDFKETINKADKDSWMIIDSPYTLRDKLYNPNGSVTVYNGKKFTLQDHEDLLNCLVETPARWLMTINDCIWIRDKYKDFNIIENPVSYSCSQTNAGRGFHSELIIKNY